MSENTNSSVGDKIKDSSLNLAGMGYLVGDAALFAHGIFNKKYSTALTGLSWGVGGLATALYGKESAEHQLSRISNDLGTYLKANGVDIPKDSGLQQEFLSKNSSVWNHVENFLYQHPSQILNATYALGSASLIKSGLKPRTIEGSLTKTKDMWEVGSGMLVGTGALLGLLLPEQAKEEDKPKVTFSRDPIGWFNEKPLRWPSLFYTANNVTLLKSGLDERRLNPSNKTHQLKFLAVAAYVASNGLLGLSSKDHTTQSGAQLSAKHLEELAAEIIAQQPQDIQDRLMHQVAAHLATHKEVDAEASELASAMADKVNTHIIKATLEGRVEERGKTLS